MFPLDGAKPFHQNLVKQNSLGSSPYSTHQHGGMATAVTISSGPPIVTILGASSVGDLKVESHHSTRRSFVSLLPPLGRSGSNEFKHGSESKIQALFLKYKDSHEDAMLAHGVENFCRDLDVKPEDFRILVFAWKCNVEQMCRFSRAEFVQGMRVLRTDSVRGLQIRLPECVCELLNDPVQFKDLYRFTFGFGLEAGQKVLPTAMAVSLWQLVFSQREPVLLCRWLEFLKAHPEIRGIPRDTWNMFLNLTEAVGDDLSVYDDSEAWPGLFDDFVEYENDNANQNVSKNDLKYFHRQDGNNSRDDDKETEF